MSIGDLVRNLRNAVAIDKDGINHVADQLEQLQAEIERLKARHESKEDCIHYIRNEAGYCKSEKRNSVYCTGVDCGFCKCVEEE